MFKIDIGILWGHLRSSYKTIIISSIGLIFALGIVSSTIIYSDTNNPAIFQNVLEQYNRNRYGYYYMPHPNNPFPDYNLRGYDFIIDARFNGLNINVSTIFQLMESKISEKAAHFQLEDKIKSVNLFLKSETYRIELNTSFKQLIPETYNSENISVVVYEISDEIKSELEDLVENSGIGIVPTQNLDLMILNLQSRNDFKISTDIENPANITHYLADNKVEINVSAIASIDQLFYSSYPNTVETLISDRSWGNVFAFVPNLKEFSDRIKLEIGSPQLYRNFYLSGGIRLNYANFNPNTAIADLKQLEKFSDRTRDAIIAELHLYIPTNYLNLQFESKWAFEMAISAVQSMTFGLLLFASPIILVALFVANYSFGLIHRSIKQQIGIYKTRGATDSLIFLMQLVDFSLIVFISVIFSMLLGAPLSLLIIRTDYFLSFNSDSITSIVVDLPNLITMLFWFGLFFGLIINSSRMIKLSKMTIAETANVTEQSEPYWYKHHLDYTFLIVGLVGFTILYLSIFERWFELGPFILLGLPAPLLLIVGAILFFSRMFPEVLSRISTKIWIKYGGLIALSIKNVIRHKQASTRAVMLIAILITFLISFLSIPYSMIVWNYNREAYILGAEGVGSDAVYSYSSFGLDNYYNETLIQFLEENYSEYFDGISPFVKLNFLGSSTGSIILINTTTFLDAAIFPINPITRAGLEKDMDLLRENTSSYNLLIQQKTLEYHGLKVRDNFTFLYSTDPINTTKFKIQDSFEFWPILYFQKYSDYEGENFYGISSFDQFPARNSSFVSSVFYIEKSGVYLNFKDGINQTLVASWLEGNFSLSIDLLSNRMQTYISSTDFLVQVGQINLNIVISILIATTILLMFAWLQMIERKKELYTERALGLKIYQLFILFLLESLVLLISGLFIGSIMGVVLTEMFGLFITLGPSIPPYFSIFALDLILGSYSIILVLAFFGALIPAFLVSRQDISSSFAGEG
ncbi:MAG: hypothetical protein HeimC3_51650 [Candidatus Heimdallarchaeota archaeon LC_3]|nr:MAG: hypothetical protein HeimC3_51650 [Candidatus Heimdallarchaeota archaeon LC_3]